MATLQLNFLKGDSSLTVSIASFAVHPLISISLPCLMARRNCLHENDQWPPCRSDPPQGSCIMQDSLHHAFCCMIKGFVVLLPTGFFISRIHFFGHLFQKYLLNVNMYRPVIVPEDLLVKYHKVCTKCSLQPYGRSKH